MDRQQNKTGKYYISQSISKVIFLRLRIQYPISIKINRISWQTLSDCALYNRQAHPDYPYHLQKSFFLDYPLCISPAHLDGPDLWRKNITLDRALCNRPTHPHDPHHLQKSILLDCPHHIIRIFGKISEWSLETGPYPL